MFYRNYTTGVCDALALRRVCMLEEDWTEALLQADSLHALKDAFAVTMLRKRSRNNALRSTALTIVTTAACVAVVWAINTYSGIH